MSDAPPTGAHAPDNPNEPERRFAPHAGREMAQMFDRVSGRYEFLNRLMTLGRDAAWRAAMWRAVPPEARVVLDLCTGDGASLGGLRRAGRLVIGADVSRVMLEQAWARHGRAGWAPRLIEADAFRLPLRSQSVDATTAAFGIRNLRPRPEALAEIARVMRPGGVLAVLEAAAPRRGWFAPFHRFHLEVLIPFFGRLSDDPSAYRYLSRSIFEFGAGPEFERDLGHAGFDLIERRSFMLGATRLWVGRLREHSGQTSAAGERGAPSAPGASARLAESPAGAGGSMQNASPRAPERSELPQRAVAWDGGRRGWRVVQALTSGAVLVALIYAAWVLIRELPGLALPLWERRGLMTLLALSIAAFGLRTTLLALKAMGPPER
jgi:demethylmenaquinone methyltransferase/2-methoxy-6-polyprenyl-1,4-benzoquinol methylase